MAVELLRRHDRALEQAAHALRTTPEQVPELVAERELRRRELEKQLRAGAGAAAGGNGAGAEASLAERAAEVGGVRVLAETAPVAEPKALMDLADRLKNTLGDSAIVLGAAGEGRVHLVAAVTPGVVERGVKAGAIVKAAAQVVGGGGGGRDTMAQAGGRDPEKLDEALAAARAEIERILAG